MLLAWILTLTFGQNLLPTILGQQVRPIRRQAAVMAVPVYADRTMYETQNQANLMNRYKSAGGKKAQTAKASIDPVAVPSTSNMQYVPQMSPLQQSYSQLFTPMEFVMPQSLLNQQAMLYPSQAMMSPVQPLISQPMMQSYRIFNPFQGLHSQQQALMANKVALMQAMQQQQPQQMQVPFIENRMAMDALTDANEDGEKRKAAKEGLIGRRGPSNRMINRSQQSQGMNSTSEAPKTKPEQQGLSSAQEKAQQQYLQQLQLQQKQLMANRLRLGTVQVAQAPQVFRVGNGIGAKQQLAQPVLQGSSKTIVLQPQTQQSAAMKQLQAASGNVISQIPSVQVSGKSGGEGASAKATAALQPVIAQLAAANKALRERLALLEGAKMESKPAGSTQRPPTKGGPGVKEAKHEKPPLDKPDKVSDSEKGASRKEDEELREMKTHGNKGSIKDKDAPVGSESVSLKGKAESPGAKVELQTKSNERDADGSSPRNRQKERITEKEHQFKAKDKNSREGHAKSIISSEEETIKDHLSGKSHNRNAIRSDFRRPRQENDDKRHKWSPYSRERTSLRVPEEMPAGNSNHDRKGSRQPPNDNQSLSRGPERDANDKLSGRRRLSRLQKGPKIENGMKSNDKNSVLADRRERDDTRRPDDQAKREDLMRHRQEQEQVRRQQQRAIRQQKLMQGQKEGHDEGKSIERAREEQRPRSRERQDRFRQPGNNQRGERKGAAHRGVDPGGERENSPGQDYTEQNVQGKEKEGVDVERRERKAQNKHRQLNADETDENDLDAGFDKDSQGMDEFNRLEGRRDGSDDDNNDHGKMEERRREREKDNPEDDDGMRTDEETKQERRPSRNRLRHKHKRSP